MSIALLGQQWVTKFCFRKLYSRVVWFLLVPTSCAVVTEHNSIINDVFQHRFNMFNLLVVILLSTPHCQWWIYSAQIHSRVPAMGTAVPFCNRSILSVFVLICFAPVLLVHYLIHLGLGNIVHAAQYSLEVSIYCAFSATFSFFASTCFVHFLLLFFVLNAGYSTHLQFHKYKNQFSMVQVRHYLFFYDKKQFIMS